MVPLYPKESVENDAKNLICNAWNLAHNAKRVVRKAKSLVCNPNNVVDKAKYAVHNAQSLVRKF